MTTSRTMGTMRGPPPPPRDKAHLHLARAHDEGLPIQVHPHGDVQDLPHAEGSTSPLEAAPLTWVWMQLFTWSRYSVALWSLALIAVAVAVGRR